MTIDEADKKFDWRYEETREYIHKIVSEHPEITDEYLIAVAAEEMLNSAECDVELSVEDALRVSANAEPTPIEDIVKMLNMAGVTNDNVMDVIRMAAEQEEEESEPSTEFAAKCALMNSFADAVSTNPDIILLEKCCVDVSYMTEVKLAFFPGDMTKDQTDALANLKSVCDSSELYTENGIAKCVFRLNIE